MTSADSPYTAGPAVPSQPGWVNPLKWLLVVVSGVLGLTVAAVCLLVSVIEYSGCFIRCNPDAQNRPLGVGLAVLAAGMAVSGPATAAAVFRSRSWRRGAVWAFCVFAAITVGWVVLGPQRT